MLHIKEYINKTLATAPYQKTLKAYVVCTESSKQYQNEKGEERQMKVSAIADNETAIKMIVYDPNKFRNVEAGNTIIIRNFIPKENAIVVTRNSKLLLTSGIEVPESVKKEAMNILHPPAPPVTNLRDAKLSPLKKRLSIQGKVIEEQIAQEVQVKNKAVQVRNITIRDDTESCKVSLWREKADLKISSGDFITITDVVVNNYHKDDISLMSTSYTTIEKCEEETKEVHMDIIGFEMQDDMVAVMVENGLQDMLIEKKFLREVFKTENDDNIQDGMLNLCNKTVFCTVQGNKVLHMVV